MPSTLLGVPHLAAARQEMGPVIRLSGNVDGADHHNDGLSQAIVGLEDALTSSVADEGKWRLRLAMAVDHTMTNIAQHLTATEASSDLLNQIADTSRHLARRVNELHVDHERLSLATGALRSTIDDVDESQTARRVPTLRRMAIELIGQLDVHRQRSEALVGAYHAYLEEPTGSVILSTHD